ncbi:hypothetical protein HID58_040093, partial [Brassica napus]
MLKKDDLHVVKPIITVDEALEILEENRVTWFPVLDKGWKWIMICWLWTGSGRTENAMFPEVDST